MSPQPPLPPDLLASLMATPAGEQLRQLVELLAGMTNTAATSPYLTTREAASYCRVAVQTIYNNRRHIERLPGVGKLLFKRAALDKWLETRSKRRR